MELDKVMAIHVNERNRYSHTEGTGPLGCSGSAFSVQFGLVVSARDFHIIFSSGFFSSGNKTCFFFFYLNINSRILVNVKRPAVILNPDHERGNVVVRTSAAGVAAVVVAGLWRSAGLALAFVKCPVVQGGRKRYVTNVLPSLFTVPKAQGLWGNM